jgi:hypothetical protein
MPVSTIRQHKYSVQCGLVQCDPWYSTVQSSTVQHSVQCTYSVSTVYSEVQCTVSVQ